MKDVLSTDREYCDCPEKTRHLLMCRLSRRAAEPDYENTLGGSKDI